jgi:hypothetical protein
VKRGSIVTLQGAKIETTMLGSGDVKIATLGYFRATMATTFSYRSLNATITEAGAQWTGSLSKGKFPVTGTMTLYGKKYNMNGYVPYHHRDSNGQMVDIGEFPTGVLPSDSVMGLYVKINSALQNPKGAIAGVAGGILDSREEPTGSNYDQRGAYKLVGARSPVTKISKLTFSGIGGNAGSSVVVHVDDSLNVQQGVGFANSLKAFGYNISF